MSDMPHIDIDLTMRCQQYGCLNNTGINCKTGGRCKLDNPDITDFGKGVWGCGDERYGNEIKFDRSEL